MPFILNNWTEILAAAPWSARRLMRAVSVGDYIYMTGGNTLAAGDRVAEVWRTKDCISWELLTDNPGWAARAAHGFVYFGGKFWVFGGSTAGGFLNDIWSSDDCITWVNEGTAGWTTRHEFGYCLHSGQIYLSGGFNGVYASDVWRTEDMINWTQTSANLGVGHREHMLMSYLGYLYCYIGDTGGVSRRYVYRSTNNGVNWTYLGETVYTWRREHAALIDEERQNLAVVGGFNTGPPAVSLNDVWETDDGFNFTQIAQINSYTARSDFCFIHHKKRLYIFGGTADSGVNMMNDVWGSPAEPGAYFSGDPTSGIYPLTVEFTNESVANALSYLWNFGDGKTSTEENPTHRYDAPGTYTVSLTSTYTEGSDTETKTNYITVTLDFTGTPLSGSVPLKVRFNL